MKQLIFHNWNFFRLIRMVLGVAIIVQAFVAKDIFLGIMGLIFSSLAIFNTGCCGPAGCNIPAKKTAEPAKEITYEEVAK